MKKILIILLMSIQGYSQCLGLDVVLLGDLSGSVQHKEEFVQDAFATFVNKFELSEDGMRVSVIIFNDQATVLTHLSSNKDEVLKAITYMPGATGSTDMASGFYAAIGELTAGRPGYRKMIIVVSDGQVDNPDITLMVSEQIRATNIHVCGVLIYDGNNEFMDMVTSDQCYVQSDYINLPAQIKKLDTCF